MRSKQMLANALCERYFYTHTDERASKHTFSSVSVQNISEQWPSLIFQAVNGLDCSPDTTIHCVFLHRQTDVNQYS